MTDLNLKTLDEVIRFLENVIKCADDYLDKQI